MIRSLLLRNFKCFREQRFKFAPLTLLSGINGMGKSSAIQSLLALRQSYDQGMLPATGLALNGELVRLGNASDVLHEGADSSDQLEIVVEFSPPANREWHFQYDREKNSLDLCSQPVTQDEVPTVFLNDDFCYLRAERVGPRMSFDVSDFHVRQHRRLGTQGELAAHYLSVYGGESLPNPRLARNGAASSSLRDQVEAWMSEVSPGVRINVSELARSQGVDIVTLQYSYIRGTQVTNQYRSTNVGFGVTYVLPIFVALLSAQPGSVIVIENPEAHLHPRGQAIIGELLARAASSGVQIIVETHSDHVMNGARIAVREKMLNAEDLTILFFERPSEERLDPNVSELKVDIDGRIDRWPDGFFDEWDRSLERLL